MADRYKTGEECPKTGHYLFDGYTDGLQTPAPRDDERVVTLNKGDLFPPIRSANKPCFWQQKR